MPEAGRTVLAVDAHGGDHGLEATIPGALAALEEDPGLDIILVGLREEIEQAWPAGASREGERLRVQSSESALPMDVRAVAALRRGAGSSLWEAVRLVSEGTAHACVSGGNTGAMMALGVRLVGMSPGIERPVLMACIPHTRGFTAALDLGANLSVTERQLVQFAVMGSNAFSAARHGRFRAATSPNPIERRRVT